MLAKRVIAALKARSPSEICRYGVILIRNAIGLPNRMPTPDREILEQVILPTYVARLDIRSVLFVGCAWYTSHYENLFPGRSYLTIDPDPWKRQFGARRHVVAGLEALGEHLPHDSLDLIICNGVFGWGLDERADCERAFQGCFDALRVSGELVIGWNDVPGHRPLDLASLEALAPFKRLCFPPLGSNRYLANPANGHVYEFYSKP